MKALFAAIALTTLGQATLAEQATPPGTAPIKLAEAQMDQVTAGGGDGNMGSSGDFRSGHAAGVLNVDIDIIPSYFGGTSPPPPPPPN